MFDLQRDRPCEWRSVSAKRRLSGTGWFVMVNHLLISESDYEFENELETSWKTVKVDIVRTLT